MEANRFDFNRTWSMHVDVGSWSECDKVDLMAHFAKNSPGDLLCQCSFVTHSYLAFMGQSP